MSDLKEKDSKTLLDEFIKEYSIFLRRIRNAKQNDCICDVTLVIDNELEFVLRHTSFYAREIHHMMEPIMNYYNYNLKPVLVFIKENFKCHHGINSDKLIAYISCLCIFYFQMKFSLDDIYHRTTASLLIFLYNKLIRNYENYEFEFIRIYNRSSYAVVYNFIMKNDLVNDYRLYFRFCNKEGIREAYEANKYQILVSTLTITSEDAKELLKQNTLLDVLIDRKVNLNILSKHVLTSFDFNKYMTSMYPKQNFIKYILYSGNFGINYFREGTGENKNIYGDDIPFNPSGYCKPGGLYFALDGFKYYRSKEPCKKVKIEVLENVDNFVYIEHKCNKICFDKHECNLHIKFKTEKFILYHES